ncbi:hypothetical protein CPB86DRAFT_521765 [Serendipita vermifera]|nr:hypothetical protein CPB86DRAFT_521765 [Serendipita vermifera]
MPPPKFRRPAPPPVKEEAANKVDDGDDDDAFFTRNTKGWSGIDTTVDSNPSRGKRGSESPEIEPTPKKRKGVKKKSDDWTKPGAIIHLDSDSDSDIKSPSRASHQRHHSGSSPRRDKGKGRAEERKKRRSITPPPSIRDADLQLAYQLTERIYGTAGPDQSHATTAPVYDELDEGLDEEEEEDPEIKAIMQTARQKYQSPGPRSPSGASRPSLANAASSFSSDPRSPELSMISPVIQPQEYDQKQADPDTLTLKVYWQGSSMPDGKNKWSFKFFLNSAFRRLNETLQDKTGLGEEDIVLVYDSKRVLLGATPKSLRMKKDTKENIDAYHKVEWDMAEAERKALLEHRASPIETDELSYQTYNASTSGPDIYDLTTTNEAEEGEEDNGGGAGNDVLVMQIRSAKYPTAVRVPARKTAKAHRVLARYLNIVGENQEAFDLLGTTSGTSGTGRGRGRGRATGPAVKPLKLSFDGEELAAETQVGNLDADDGDMWDVIGL